METTHGEGTQWYHKSVRLKVGDSLWEFHGPNVKARKTHDDGAADDHASYHVDFETDDEGKTVAVLAPNRACPYCQAGEE